MFILKSISASVKASSKRFKVDQAENSKYDTMVNNNCLQKLLENDQFTYVEGIPNESKRFLSQFEKKKIQ